MYKILVVHNDEQKMEIIKNAIVTNVHDVLVMYAYSGTQALKMIKSERPDIVFLTIELIDVSGIDVADEVMQRENAPKIVFISQYDYFEFARKAVQIGISDYLIEPITEHDIVETTFRLTEEVQSARNLVKEREEQKEQLKDFYELTGYSFIYTVLFDGRTAKNVDDYKKILGISDKGFWLNIEFENRIYDLGLNNYNIALSIRKILGNDYRYIVGPKLFNRYIIYVSVEDDEQRKNDKDYAIEMASILKTGLEKKYRYNVNIGIGSVQKTDKLHISYEESIRSLRINSDEQIIYINDVDKEKMPDLNEYMNYEKKIMENIELGKEDTLDLFSMLLTALNKLGIHEKRNKILETLVLSCHAINRLGASECEYIDYARFYEEFLIVNDDELDAWAINKFQYILKSARTNVVENVSETVKTAIYYVYEHYGENITLNDVSGMVGVTLQYFSKIFKDETGMNFIDWLNRFRVNKAKELMGTSQFTIKEVCFKVGYNDPNYFSRIFKRYEGIAPTEYLGRKENVS